MQRAGSTTVTNVPHLPVEEALAALGSGAAGLTSREASRWLARDGPNRIENKAGPPMVIRLASEFFRFFSVILWIAAALTFIADRVSPDQDMARIRDGHLHRQDRHPDAKQDARRRAALRADPRR